MPRIRAETLCSPAELTRATGIPFEPLIPIGRPDGLGRAMPGLLAIPREVRGLYTIWASCHGGTPVLLYGGKCVAETGIRHRILTHFLRSQNEGKPGRLGLNGGSYIHLLLEHMGLSATYFVSLSPIADAPTTHAKEKALLFQIDFIANDAENSGRRGVDLKGLFLPPVPVEPIVPVAPVTPAVAEPEPQAVVTTEAVQEQEPVVVVEKPKKVKKTKKVPSKQVELLTSDLASAQARIAELEARVQALTEEKAKRKALQSELRMLTEAVEKLRPIYAGNAYLEASYASADERREMVRAELEAMDA